MRLKCKRFVRVFLCSLLIIASISLFIGEHVKAADMPASAPRRTFASMPVIPTTDGSYYYKISNSDFTSYAKNMTAVIAYHNVEWLYDGDGSGDGRTEAAWPTFTESPTRVSYEKKFSVSKGTVLNLIGAKNDVGGGGSNTTSTSQIVWNAIEWDKDGYCIYDTGWMPCTESWTVGGTRNGGVLISPSKSRSEVAYVTLIFRYATLTDDASIGSQAETITPATIVNDFPNLYLCYKPFTYTISNQDSTNTVSRTGVTAITPLPALTKTGYTGTWNVSNSLSGEYNWMKGNSYSSEQLNAWMSNGNFYNSLLGNVTFTSSYLPNNYTIHFNPNGGSFTDSSGTDVTSVGVTYDATKNYTLTSYIPQRAGYTFNGWHTAVNGGVMVYNANLTAANDGTYFSDNKWKYAGDLNLYAQWTQNTYTIIYNANGGYSSATMKNYHYGDVVDLSPKATKDGYTFIGWSTNPSSRISLSSLKMPDLAADGKTGLTLYAVYSKTVSDVANHTYPDYNRIKELEVFLRVWQTGTPANYKDYPLTYKYDTNAMVYRYTLNSTSVTDFVAGMESYSYKVFAYDNAGNWSVLAEGVVNPLTGQEDESKTPEIIEPGPKAYLQTVNHYRYDAVLESWVKFDTVTAMAKEGTLYTPAYVTAPTGYKTFEKDGGYIVTQTTTSSAYYKPIDYTLTFNANGGNCSTASKSISYGSYYGELPMPTRAGYTFAGWYTSSSGGKKVGSSDKYVTAGNTTIYAQWTINSYTVIYDYKTNGGISVSTLQKDYNYGSEVDLGVSADKNGWTFIGWNMDPNATMGLDSIKMTDRNITLYAIFQKDITVTLQEQTDAGTVLRNLSKTIYNRETQASFAIPQTSSWAGWTLLGWTTETGAMEVPEVGVAGTYSTAHNATLYALYISQVTVSYDTNGAGIELDKQTKECYFNASGNSAYPLFMIAKAPKLSGNTFVNWTAEDGTTYDANVELVISKDTHLTAKWDKYPEIEAYDRYFTLVQARGGEITHEELLKKVVVTDKEDGTLVNGTDVIVKDYNPTIFTDMTADEEVNVIYQATDSFGNTITKTITVTVTDTGMKKSAKKKYVRFISSRFFADDAGNLISYEHGGLEETSIWRTNENYRTLLQNTLSKR